MLQGVRPRHQVKWTSAVPVTNDKLRLSIRNGGRRLNVATVQGPSVLRTKSVLGIGRP